MPDWLTILLPTLAGLAGVGLGAWMNQRGAKKLSKQTLDGQRVLAHDTALREWRRQQVTPFLEAANQRITLWLELRLAKAAFEGLTDEERKQHPQGEQEKLSLLQKRLLDPYINTLLLLSLAVPDKEFSDAFSRLLAAENPFRPDLSLEEIRVVMGNMHVEIVILNRAAERYIFSSL